VSLTLSGQPAAEPEARMTKREAWAHRKRADQYIDDIGSYARSRDDAVLRRLLGNGPGRSLDIPCGTGRFIDLQHELGYSVIAADYSPTMLAEAFGTATDSFVRADVFHPPFKAQSFDVILISRLMFHYPDPVAILRSVLPMLRDRGRIVFDTLNTGSLRWFTSAVLRSRQATLATRLYFENPFHLAQRLRGAGLEITEYQSCYVLPTRAYRFLPRWLVRLFHGLEKFWPQRLRVLSFWQVRLKNPVSNPVGEQSYCRLLGVM
jgi:SAM-dependent methyltransferase